MNIETAAGGIGVPECFPARKSMYLSIRGMDKKLSLLIVEDNAVSAGFLKSMLEHSGLPLETVSIAGTLAEAADRIRQEPPDAILLDLNLPDSQGPDTLERIIREFPEKPIIVVTGEFDEAAGADAIRRGAQDYLLKGKYSIEELSKSIRYSIRRKEAQEAAKRSERIFKTLIETLPQMILLKDIYSRYVFCNQNYARRLGVPAESILGKTDRDFYPPDIAQRSVASDQAVIQLGKIIEDEYRQSRDGTECVLRVLKTPVKSDSGRVEGVLCVYEDFTKRSQYEEEIRRANETLQAANRQLQEAQAQIVQNEKLASIGQLAAGVAHEINNPLGFVNSNFSTLEMYLASILSVLSAYDAAAHKFRKGDPQAIEEALAYIESIKQEEQIDFVLQDIPGLFSDSKEGVRRIIQIVKSLRDFSRIDQPEDFSDYNINQGLEATLTVARNELKYAAEIRTEYGEVPDIFCNSGQLNQVFLNILVNAAQAIESQHREERGLITIKTYADEQYVNCEITDDGPGIPPDILPKIFDPFFTTKPVGKGTGLGLNVSYDIVVNKHKGQLLVRSEVGRGTTFTIRIPRDSDLKEQMCKAVQHGTEESLVCR